MSKPTAVTSYDKLSAFLQASWDNAIATKAATPPPSVLKGSDLTAEMKKLDLTDYKGVAYSIELDSAAQGNDFKLSEAIEVDPTIPKGAGASLNLQPKSGNLGWLAWKNYHEVLAHLNSAAPGKAPAGGQDPATKKAMDKLKDDLSKAQAEAKEAEKKANALDKKNKGYAKTLRKLKKKGSPSSSSRVPTAQRNPSLATQVDRVDSAVQSQLKNLFGKEPEQTNELTAWKEIVAFIKVSDDKLISMFDTAFDAFSKGTKTTSDWETLKTTWGEWLIGEGDQTQLRQLSSLTEKELEEICKSIPNPIWEAVYDEYSKQAKREAEEIDEGKRTFGGYFSDTVAAWTKFVTNTWSDGVTGKLLSIVKTPLAIIGFVGSMLLDILAKPLTGTSINRNFAENQGIDLTYAKSSSVKA